MNANPPWYLVNRPYEDFTAMWEDFRAGFSDSMGFRTDEAVDTISREMLTDALFGDMGGVRFEVYGHATLLTPVPPPRPDEPTIEHYLSSYPNVPESGARRSIVARRREVHEHFWRVFLGHLHNQGMPPTALHRRAWQRLLESWAGMPDYSPVRIRLPWQTLVPLPLSDVRAAVYSHLEHLAGKRFPAEWDVQVQPYVEQTDLAYRYDTKSSNRTVGHIHLRHVDGSHSDLEITEATYGDESDGLRLREILAQFASWWLEDIGDQPARPPLETAGLALGDRIDNSTDTQESPSAELSYIEQKIKDAYDEILQEGEVHPTDENIAARLPLSQKSEPYARETVNRKRQDMRSRGIDV